MDKQLLKLTLTHVSFTADFPEQLLDALVSGSRAQFLPAGEILFREGSENHNLYLISSGRLALEMNVPGRGTTRILTLGEGDMVGWSALLGQGNMTASAIAIEACEVILIEADFLLELCETNYEFGFHLMRQMAAAISRRLVATRLQLLDLFDQPAPFSRAQESETEG